MQKKLYLIKCAHIAYLKVYFVLEWKYLFHFKSTEETLALFNLQNIVQCYKIRVYFIFNRNPTVLEIPPKMNLCVCVCYI